MSDEPYLEPLWAFVRRDLRAPRFRDWLHQTAAAEDVVGTALYLDLLALDFDDPRAVAAQRAQLRNHLVRHHPPRCDCPLTGSRERLPIGAVPSDLDGFTVLRRRTPWLELARCRTCGTFWYIATDTVGDDFYFLRLDADAADAVLTAGFWPSDFEDRPACWPQTAWLQAHGYADLAEWQQQHGVP